MKLDEIRDDAPLIMTLLQNLLKKNVKVQIRDRNGVYRNLMFVAQRKLDGVWVLRGVGEKIDDIRFDTQDLRLPADAEADHLLNLHKSEDTNEWVLHPRWQRIRELGYQ